MDWKQEARKDLQNYQRRKTALENMKQMVCLLQDDYFALRTGSFDTAPVMGKGSGSEEWMLNNIVKRERLQHNINATQAWISFIENGLRCLTDQQRDILTEFYYRPEAGACGAAYGEVSHGGKAGSMNRKTRRYMILLCLPMD